jgi:defect-in-organelle-trafficking protein DotB
MAELEGLLIFLKGLGFSDLVLTSGSRAAARVDGVWRPCSGRPLQTGEIAALLDCASGNAAAASIVMGGADLDFGFEVEESRLERLRFRGNAAGVAAGWGTGLTVTLRLIPGAPPSLDDLGVEGDLRAALFPENGLVLATGAMGSGKTTLLAAVMRAIVEKGGRHVCTYEAPVEFDLSSAPGALPPLEQSEIPRHMPDFRAAVRNLARRAADAVLVGEARDPETLRGVLEAAELGLACYATAHTRSVSAAPGRILNVFGPAERPGLAASLFSSLRACVQQRLFPSPGGGRHAVREYLAFDQPMRDALQAEDPSRTGALLEEMVAERGMPLLRAAERAAGLGLIFPEALASVRAEKGAGGGG